MKFFGFVLFIFLSSSLCHADTSVDASWFLKSINLPEKLTSFNDKKKIVIAVVDDGMRTSHHDLKDFIWVNPNEIADNGIDDDGNGAIDDIHGWDVSDNNNSVLPPQSRLKTYYHGTHVAGVITQIVNTSLGGAASDFIKLMPVKAISDKATDRYFKEAYQGIEYAIDAGADIILTAWGVGPISTEEIRILEKAKRKGILIIASSGNYLAEKKQYPAAYPSVIAISGLDQHDQKLKHANFGQFVDLSAPAENINSSSSLSNTGRISKEGTSVAAAIAAAAAALVALKHPTYNAEQIKVCLESSASDLNEIQPIYRGKLGAGKLNVDAAIKCAFYEEDITADIISVLPQGYLRIKSANKNNKFTWKIHPDGEFKGLRFNVLGIKGEVGNAILNIYSGSNLKTAKLIKSYPLEKLPEEFYVSNTTVSISIESEKEDLKFDGLLHYEAETIDFTKLYCNDEIYLYEEGVIEDGSGDKDYSYHSSCKWLITAPEGKVIKFKFSELDTEYRTDLIYFFNGSGTHEDIMAIFSGSKLPPELTTWHNQVLVWFASNEKNQGKGWKAKYTFEDYTPSEHMKQNYNR